MPIHRSYFFKDPGKYKNRSLFFGERQISIAGKQLSLDDIEHGILRHSKIKWSLGHLNKWFPSAFEKAQGADSRLSYSFCFELRRQKLPAHCFL